MKIAKELSENQTVLFLMPSTDYNNIIMKMAKILSEKSVCYVTLNKTYDSLKELFEKKNVNTDNIIFIDAISKTMKKISGSTENCYYVSSPGALTEISLTIGKFLKHNFDYIIIDSVTNLSIYQKRKPIAKFIIDLVNKIKKTETKAAFYALNIKDQEALVKQVSTFVDNIIDLEKEKLNNNHNNKRWFIWI